MTKFKDFIFKNNKLRGGCTLTPQGLHGIGLDIARRVICWQ
jgi:hypothetical protein